MPVGRMRAQIQWGQTGGNIGVTFGRGVHELAQGAGVTLAQAQQAIMDVAGQVEPRAAKAACARAVGALLNKIASIPPHGIAQRKNFVEYFQYARHTDARVELENLAGHNLRT
jgi:hypothetical protein